MARAADVQHHRRRCLDQDDLDNDRRADDVIDIDRRDRALATRRAHGLVLHLRCTPADSIKIGDRLRTAFGRSGARKQGVQRFGLRS
jgi:hypothetical protein